MLESKLITTLQNGLVGLTNSLGNISIPSIGENLWFLLTTLCLMALFLAGFLIFILAFGLIPFASLVLSNDRQNTHGQPEDSFRRIADLWSGYLTVGVHEQDVAVMMALVKVARIMENPQHADNWIDGAGYFACGGEVALRKN